MHRSLTALGIVCILSGCAHDSQSSLTRDGNLADHLTPSAAQLLDGEGRLMPSERMSITVEGNGFQQTSSTLASSISGRGVNRHATRNTVQYEPATLGYVPGSVTSDRGEIIYVRGGTTETNAKATVTLAYRPEGSARLAGPTHKVWGEPVEFVVYGDSVRRPAPFEWRVNGSLNGSDNVKLGKRQQGIPTHLSDGG